MRFNLVPIAISLAGIVLCFQNCSLDGAPSQDGGAASQNSTDNSHNPSSPNSPSPSPNPGPGQAKVETIKSGSSWTVPAGVTSIDSVECWGAGGGPGSGTGAGFAGGGGGAYSKIGNLAVNPGSTINFSIGVGGTAAVGGGVGVAGGDTWFNSPTTVLAKGGSGGHVTWDGNAGVLVNSVGGAGGAAAQSVGNIVHSGGRGGIAQDSMVCAGGGGAGASPSGDGGTAGNGIFSTMVGGVGGSSPNAGTGGLGGVSGALNGVAGLAHELGGGGGGGGCGIIASGGSGGFPGGGAGAKPPQGLIVTPHGAGAAGQIVIRYRVP